MAQKTLNIFLGEDLVGRLEQDNSGTTRFEYIQAWLDSPTAVPLSASLPLRPERYSRNETRPFFAGVLPEEESRRLIAKNFGVSDKNDFELLSRLGAECAGRSAFFLPANFRWQPSQLYDLVSTRAYPELASEMAMKLGGERDPLRLTGKNWGFFFDHAGIGHSVAQKRLRSTAEHVLVEAEELSNAECPGAGAVLPIIRLHRTQILTSLP